MNRCRSRHRREHPDRVVRDQQIEAAAPELILLSNEPDDFGLRNAQELAALRVRAAESGRIPI